MTTVLLIRHGMCDPVGKSIAGRTPGVHLNRQGRAQAADLARVLSRLPIEAVYSSPMERAVETALPLGLALGRPVREAPGLTELDFGEWTGRSLVELERDPRWPAFNEHREATRIPGGESMGEVVSRAVGTLSDILRTHGEAVVAAVSHGDVIRAVLMHCLGAPLDRIHGLEVAPGSVSAVQLGEGASRVLAVNWRGDRPV